MNKRVIKPMLEFLSKADSGVWMTDFQFHHINYASRDLACTINAGINYNNTTFIIEIEDEGVRLQQDARQERPRG